MSGVATPRDIWVGLTDDRTHGPLAGILTILTVIAGLVDATSLLRLDRVFVANVTGSVIFIGLALVGARGFSLAAPLIALATFLVGAGLGVRVFARHVTHRGRSAYAASLAQFVDLLIASAIALFDHHPTDPVRLTLVAILALGMGAKSALVRSVNVPGLTTAVVTTTLTGLAFRRCHWIVAQHQLRGPTSGDLRSAGGGDRRWGDGDLRGTLDRSRRGRRPRACGRRVGSLGGPF